MQTWQRYLHKTIELEARLNTTNNYLLRPIISCIESTPYNTSNFLPEILSPIQNSNGYSVKNSVDFKDKITSVTIDEDDTMLSYDVN